MVVEAARSPKGALEEAAVAGLKTGAHAAAEGESNQLLIEPPFRGEFEVVLVKHETSCFGALIQIALDWA